MATTVSIDGQVYKRRSPLGVIGLSLITIGIYGLYWYYKVNDEARTYLRTSPSNRVSPCSQYFSAGC
jgi:hypothetical protein